MNELPSKEEQRKDLRKLRLGCEMDSSAVSSKIVDFLFNHSEYQTIALYSALSGEVDLTGISQKISRCWVYPRVVENDLEFYRVENLEVDLIQGAYGIWEPKRDLTRVALQEIDLFVCPGLGFDLRGGRLGRGKGFYDRALSQARADAWKIGVCFPYQVLEKIATEPHDVKMDSVIVAS